MIIFLGLHINIAVFNIEPQTNLIFYIFIYLQLLIASIAMLFPYFLQLKFPSKNIKMLIKYISTRSYSIYLVNYSIVLLGIQRINNLDLNAAVKLLGYLFFTLLFSEMLYRFVELPMLQYRDKKYKTIK